MPSGDMAKVGAYPDLLSPLTASVQWGKILLETGGNEEAVFPAGAACLGTRV